MATSLYAPSSYLPLPDELIPPRDPTTFETWKAQLSYSYSPILNHIKNNSEPNNFYRDDDYNPFEEDFTGYEEHSRYLIENAANPDHMESLKQRIDKSRYARDVLSRSSITQQLVAGVFDPINVVTIPFGGPSIGFWRSAGRVGLGVGVISAGQEMARVPFDPTNEKYEAPFNIGMGIASGMILGGAASFLKRTPKERKATEALQRDSETQMVEKTTLTKPEFDNRLPRDERQFSELSDKQVHDSLNTNDAQLNKLQSIFDNATDDLNNINTRFELRIKKLPPKVQKIEKIIDDLKIKQQEIQKQIRDFFEENSSIAINKFRTEILAQSDTKISTRGVVPKNQERIQKLGIQDGKKTNGIYNLDLVIKISRDPDVIEFRKDNAFKSNEMDILEWIYKNAVEAQSPAKDKRIHRLGREFNEKEMKDRMAIIQKQFTQPENEMNPDVPNTFLKDINQELNEVTDELTKYRKQIAKILGPLVTKAETKLLNAKKDLNNKQDIVNAIRLEDDLRLMEATENFGVDIKQDQNWFTRSPFNKWVHTPLKDLINSNAPNFVKKWAIDIAADGGFITNIHKMGQSMGQSVYMSLFPYKGEVHKSISELQGLWAEAGKRNQKTFLMYNVSNGMVKFSNKFRKVNAKELTFEEWSTNINRHRVLETDPSQLSDIDKRAINVINNFYDKWEVRLKETGMIGDQKFFKNMQLVKGDALAKFQERLDKLLTRKEKTENYWAKALPKKQKWLRTLNTMEKNRGLTAKQRQSRIEVTNEINELLKAKKKGPLSVRDTQYLNTLETETIPRLKKEFNNIEKQLLTFEESRVRPTNEKFMHPRYWNRGYIKKNLQQFKNILKQYYGHPNNNLIVDRKLDGTFKESIVTDENIDKWVDDIVNDIMAQEDILDPENAFYGMGKSKHLKHRTIDIPNKLVFDFIQQNPIQVMGAYIARTAPAYEFNLKFGGRSYGDLVDEIRSRSHNAGHTQEEVDSYVMNFSHLYDRVVGAVIKEPTRMSLKIANMLRTVAQLNYLGSAGLSAISEPFKIIFENGASNSLRGLLTGLDVRMGKQMAVGSAKETMLSGEALEPVFGTVHMRMVDELTLDPFTHTVWDSMKDSFYIVNMLGPVTNALKQWTGITNQHTIIETLLKVSNNKAIADDLTYLARYGLDKDDASKVSKLVSDGTIQKTDRGLYYANTEEWTDLEFQKKFRVSLASNVMNTIMMGTPADKPKLVDGIAYIPMKYAKFFPRSAIKEDARVSGYVRIENGLLGLPFQFYSYSLASVNKVNASFASGQSKSKAMAVITAMGLSYLGQKIRTPSYVWDQMNEQDKVMRAFDYSGLASLYSGLYYEAMHTSLAVGGPDISGGLLRPKFNPKNKGVENVVGLSGAGPSWFFDFSTNSFELAFDKELDYSEGVFQFVNGDRGNAAKQLMRSAPFARIPWWKEQVYQITNAIDRNVD